MMNHSLTKQELEEALALDEQRLNLLPKGSSKWNKLYKVIECGRTLIEEGRY